MADPTQHIATANDCANCGKMSNDLKRCGKCLMERYCGRDCQKAHWKTHKKACASHANAAAGGSASSSSSNSAAAGRQSTTKGLEDPVWNPFTRLDKGTWLHGRSEHDAYKLLIDTCRMRMADEYTFEGHARPGSVFNGRSTSSIRAFQSFLDETEAKHRKLLPDWWNDEKRQECEKTGMDTNAWESLSAKPGKGDFIAHYGDGNMPMQLRMFSEIVYGRGVGGADGKTMRHFLMASEAGSKYSSTIDMSELTAHFRGN